MRASRPHALRAGLVSLLTVVAAAAGPVSVPAASAATPAVTTAVSAGLQHTCAVVDGGAKCWGRNIVGQLGDGTTATSLAPVDVAGLTSGIASISSGWGHACALTTSGGVKCWGRNGFGQLGDGTTSNSSIPVDVLGLGADAVAVSAGGTHTCALTASGGVKCWGRNIVGQLGDGSLVDSSTPVDVLGLTADVVGVSVDGSHTCAVTAAGAAKCWGDNYYGQLGNGTTVPSSTPVDVVGLSTGVSAVSAGAHTCAVRKGGMASSAGAKCWGSGTDGELGNGATADSFTPVSVSSLTVGVSAISVGGFHTCAIKAKGAARCWGANPLGQLGNGTTTGSSTPLAVSGLPRGLAAISAGGTHTCALTGTGTVECWGDNFYGQLGDGTRIDRFTPVVVTGLGGLPPDEAAPVVTVELTAPNAGEPDGTGGWFVHGPVTGIVTADDAATGGSNIVTPKCTGVILGTPAGGGTPTVSAPFSIATDGLHHLSCTAKDAEGNLSAPVTKDVALDTTLPVVKVKVLPKNVYLNGAAAASFKAHDKLGAVTTNCPSVDTSQAGRVELVCTGIDEAGNVGVGTAAYVVKYRILSFSSVGGSSFPSGSTIPVMLALGDDASARISDDTAQGIASGCSASISFSGGDPADPCVSLYDAASDRFSYSLPTSAALAPGPYTLTITITLPGGVIEKASRSITLT